MFDGLLKSKFYSKCKPAIKLTKTRIEIIMRRRNSMQKHLKNDIADLLKNRLHVEAYGRAEGLSFELNLSDSYTSVEKFGDRVVDNLSLMDKQRECPEECREAVSSLIFAAARFADLPELRELRRAFIERYGNSVDAYVNKEFVEKLKATPATKHMRLQLMQDIALESAIDWNCKALEQKLFNLPASPQDRPKGVDDEKCELQESGDDYKKKKNEESVLARTRKEVTDQRNKLIGGEAEREHRSRQPHGSPEIKSKKETTDRNGQQKDTGAERNVPKEKADDEKPFYYRSIPPPYRKSKPIQQETKPEASLTESRYEEKESKELNGHNGDKYNEVCDDPATELKPKPRSVRQRRLKPPPGHAEVGNVESKTRDQDAEPSHNKISNNKGHGAKDEEERMMDNLLMHYSRKQSLYELGKVEAALKPPPLQQAAARAARHGNKEGRPARATSLPPEPTSPQEGTKIRARAASFQQEMLSPTGPVHPKLPDYDDFVARLASLRGK